MYNWELCLYFLEFTWTEPGLALKKLAEMARSGNNLAARGRSDQLNRIEPFVMEVIR